MRTHSNSKLSIVKLTCKLYQSVFFLLLSFSRRTRSLDAGLWLLTGWALHYVPFWAMGRVLYFHHYFPALLFSNMLSAVVVDHAASTASAAAAACLPHNAVLGRALFFHAAIGAVVATAAYGFFLFSPLAYGMDETPGNMPNSSVHHLKWISSWEF